VKDYLSSSPVFSDRVNLLEETDTDHADNFNIATKQLFDNIMCLKNAICKEMQSQTLEAGKTEVIFAFSEPVEDCIINIRTNTACNWLNCTTVGNTVTVAFEPQKTDVTVEVVLSDKYAFTRAQEHKG